MVMLPSNIKRDPVATKLLIERWIIFGYKSSKYFDSTIQSYCFRNGKQSEHIVLFFMQYTYSLAYRMVVCRKSYFRYSIL